MQGIAASNQATSFCFMPASTHETYAITAPTTLYNTIRPADAQERCGKRITNMRLNTLRRARTQEMRGSAAPTTDVIPQAHICTRDARTRSSNRRRNTFKRASSHEMQGNAATTDVVKLFGQQRHTRSRGTQHQQAS